MAMSGLIVSLSKGLVCEQQQMDKIGIKQTLYCQPQDEEDDIVEISTLIYTPPAMIVKKENDQEQLSKDWEQYIKGFKAFLKAMEVAGIHAEPKVAGTPCVACVKSKQLLILVGGTEVRKLFNLIGKVVSTDSWGEALNKVLRGISEQIDQAAARFEKVQQMRGTQLKNKTMKLSKQKELEQTGMSVTG